MLQVQMKAITSVNLYYKIIDQTVQKFSYVYQVMYLSTIFELNFHGIK